MKVPENQTNKVKPTTPMIFKVIITFYSIQYFGVEFGFQLSAIAKVDL